MAINKIILKIQEEASQEVAELLAAAKNKAAASSNKINDAAMAKVEEIKELSEVDAVEVARRQLLIAELEARKNTLDRKRKVIEEVFTQAENELANLPQDKWEKLIISTVLNASETGTEKLCVPLADIEKYKSGLLAKINAALVKAGKKGELTLAEETAKFAGGVLLIGQNSDFDGSFETILREVRRKSEREVASLLFGAEVN
ncbi:V-type proton ATPase subunit E [bioreactor metagenome]|uniref:V-type proton ATPase subunit E n=1 Tax=bioreactor metagenome TaxID=1076179 RepID=A0A645DR31_9ZZZZ